VFLGPPLRHGLRGYDFVGPMTAAAAMTLRGEPRCAPRGSRCPLRRSGSPLALSFGGIIQPTSARYILYGSEYEPQTKPWIQLAPTHQPSIPLKKKGKIGCVATKDRYLRKIPPKIYTLVKYHRKVAL
jgi:hypothetical protein